MGGCGRKKGRKEVGEESEEKKFYSEGNEGAEGSGPTPGSHFALLRPQSDSSRANRCTGNVEMSPELETKLLTSSPHRKVRSNMKSTQTRGPKGDV